MATYVRRQTTALREVLAADGAGVWAVAGMDPHVYQQAAGLGEGLAAGGAGVGAVASMGASVRRQTAGLREVLAACGAGEGAVAGMDPHVYHQAAGLREGLAACSAGVGALMGAHVLLQVGCRREGLVTGGALKFERSPLPDTPPLHGRNGALFPPFYVVVGERRQQVAVGCGTGDEGGRQYRDEKWADYRGHRDLLPRSTHVSPWRCHNLMVDHSGTFFCRVE